MGNMTFWLYDMRSLAMWQSSTKYRAFQLLLLAIIVGGRQIETSQINGSDGSGRGKHPETNNNNNDLGHNNVGYHDGGTNTVNDDSTQCPSFTDNSACPCYKFEDGKIICYAFCSTIIY